MACWVLKTEPETYSFDDLVKDGGTAWDGVRNYTARLNLKAMKKGERCYIYHSVGPKEIVGVAVVAREAYPDPRVPPDDPDYKKGWLAVDVKAKRKLPRPVTLAELKAHKVLGKMILVRQSRLSVCPLTDAEEKALLALAGA